MRDVDSGERCSGDWDAEEVLLAPRQIDPLRHTGAIWGFVDVSQSPAGGPSAGPMHAPASAATGRTKRQALVPRGGSAAEYAFAL